MSKPGSDELLRQNVFSSIHMSTQVKMGQVSMSYPSCSFCGKTGKGGSRKVRQCYFSLYTNSSESFVVWYKKQDGEPKGMLWLKSCCVRRGAECSAEATMPIELISKGCRGRCSYTLRFSNRGTAEEWYRSLRSESRKNGSGGSTGADIDEYDPFSSDSGEDSNPLDEIFSESPSSREQGLTVTKTRRKISSPSFPKRQSPDNKKQTPGSSKKRFQIPSSFTAAIIDRKVSLPAVSTVYSGSAIEGPSSPVFDSDIMGRWSSWPVKVGGHS
uniref:PH domain-containing protein n=1 Tax=Amphimedon queenslandica TaxID=400682 RepID=A0A1X7VL50_AMPQE